MNLFQKYGIKEVADVVFYSIDSIGDEQVYTPVLYLDSLKVSTLEQTSEKSEARGGLGNKKLITWNYGKEITLSLQDALFTPASMNLFWGGKMNNHLSSYMSAILKCNLANKYKRYHYSAKAFPSPTLTDKEWEIIYNAAERCNFVIDRVDEYDMIFNLQNETQTAPTANLKQRFVFNDNFAKLEPYISEHREQLRQNYYHRDSNYPYNLTLSHKMDIENGGELYELSEKGLEFGDITLDSSAIGLETSRVEKDIIKQQVKTNNEFFSNMIDILPFFSNTQGVNGIKVQEQTTYGDKKYRDVIVDRTDLPYKGSDTYFTYLQDEKSNITIQAQQLRLSYSAMDYLSKNLIKIFNNLTNDYYFGLVLPLNKFPTINSETAIDDIVAFLNSLEGEDLIAFNEVLATTLADILSKLKSKLVTVPEQSIWLVNALKILQERVRTSPNVLFTGAKGNQSAYFRVLQKSVQGNALTLRLTPHDLALTNYAPKLPLDGITIYDGTSGNKDQSIKYNYTEQNDKIIANLAPEPNSVPASLSFISCEIPATLYYSLYHTDRIGITPEKTTKQMPVKLKIALAPVYGSNFTITSFKPYISCNNRNYEALLLNDSTSTTDDFYNNVIDNYSIDFSQMEIDDTMYKNYIFDKLFNNYHMGICRDTDGLYDKIIDVLQLNSTHEYNQYAVSPLIVQEISRMMLEENSYTQLSTTDDSVKVLDKMEKCIVSNRGGLRISQVKQQDNLLRYYMDDRSSSYEIYYDVKTMSPLAHYYAFDETEIAADRIGTKYLEPSDPRLSPNDSIGAALSRKIETISSNEYSRQYKVDQETKEFILPVGTIYYKWTRTVSRNTLITDENESETLGERITINPDTFPEKYMIVGNTYIRNQKTGKDQRYQFTIHRAAISTDTNITLEAEGEPTVFDMSVDVLCPPNNKMMELVQYDVIEDQNGDGTKVVPHSRNYTRTFTKIAENKQEFNLPNNEIY